MRIMAWTCLWPGLPALWMRGRWSGLALALVFAGLVNLALVATLAGDLLAAAGNTRWLVPLVTWCLVVGLWVLGIRIGWEEVSGRVKASAEPLAQIDEWLREAQTHYLKAHWIEAETLLAKLLDKRPDDVEARLLLATVLRRTGRAAQAKTLLTELQSDAAAAGWNWEIETELARVSVGGELPHAAKVTAERRAA